MKARATQPEADQAHPKVSLRRHRPMPGLADGTLGARLAIASLECWITPEVALAFNDTTIPPDTIKAPPIKIGVLEGLEKREVNSLPDNKQNGDIAAYCLSKFQREIEKGAIPKEQGCSEGK